MIQAPTFELMLLYSIAGLLSTGLAVPLILRKVKLNGWYGFRTPKTMRDERTWYAANAFTGKLLLMWGLVVTFASIVLFFVPAIRADVNLYSSLVTGVVFAGIFVMVGASFWYLRKL